MCGVELPMCTAFCKAVYFVCPSYLRSGHMCVTVHTVL
jgi:hypothetical protein